MKYETYRNDRKFVNIQSARNRIEVAEPLEFQS